MRILQVSSAPNLGGGETHVRQLLDQLRRRGHHVVVAGRRQGPLRPDIELPFRNSVDVLSAWQLRSVLKQHPFDILHAHVARDYTIVAASAWGLRNVKLVFTRHLLLPVRAHPLYRRVDGWIAPTLLILKTLDSLRPKQSAVIPNWVDTEKFLYKPHPPHVPVVIGILGEISPHKGHDDAIQAMRRLGSGFHLRIAGKGASDYVSTLKRKSEGLPVEFLGFVSPASEFFQMIDILAVPSWEEPFGIVILEAMASGIPVIATNRGGPPEIIPTPQHGILIPPRDPDALAGAIQSLAENGRRLSMAETARRHVEKNFDIQGAITRVEEFYRRVIEPDSTV